MYKWSEGISEQFKFYNSEKPITYSYQNSKLRINLPNPPFVGESNYSLNLNVSQYLDREEVYWEIDLQVDPSFGVVVRNGTTKNFNQAKRKALKASIKYLKEVYFYNRPKFNLEEYDREVVRNLTKLLNDITLFYQKEKLDGQI